MLLTTPDTDQDGHARGRGSTPGWRVSAEGVAQPWRTGLVATLRAVALGRPTRGHRMRGQSVRWCTEA